MVGRWLAGTLAIGLLAGCGTTVPLAQQRALEGSGGNTAAGSQGGLGAPGATSSGSSVPGSGGGGSGLASPTGSGSAASSGSAGTGGGGSAGGAAGGAGCSGCGSSGAAASGANGPGVTASTITIGATYDTSAAAEDAGLGVAGISPGNVQAETNAMVSYVNAHGGVAGRRVKMVYYTYDSSQSSTQVQQGSCNLWTQDTKTFVMEGGLPIWDQCAAKAGGIGIAESFVAETTASLRQYPSTVLIDGFSIDRSERSTIEGLARQGYFSTGAKVGIATWDEPDYRYGITQAALPALSNLGIHNVPVEYVTVPQSYSDLSSTSSSVASAVLNFHSHGIDHVILFDGPAGVNSDGVMVIEWMQQANAQGYYPHYGLNTTSGFSSLSPDYPSKELANSTGIGWFPSIDLSSGDYSAMPKPAGVRACMQIMTAGGQAPQNSNQESVELGVCNEFLFLQMAFSRVTGPLNQQTALAAIDSLGTGFQDLTTIGTRFSDAQHDGATLVRNARYVSSCNCYRYTSGPYNPGS